eukprot:gene2162-2661_t
MSPPQPQPTSSSSSSSSSLSITTTTTTNTPNKNKPIRAKQLFSFSELIGTDLTLLLEEKNITDKEIKRKEKLIKEREKKLEESVKIWNDDIIPNWSQRKNSKKVRDLIALGIPSLVRTKVWTLLIGNDLNITPELFSIFGARAERAKHKSENSSLGREGSVSLIHLDLPRTFPMLSIFQTDGPCHQSLANVLEAYVCYRPDVGYVQGMSYLAAIFLLILSEFDSFMQVYMKAMDSLMQIHLPKVQKHLKELGIQPDIFMIDWVLTIFSKALPLDIASHIWDNVFLDGEIVIFQTALGILKMYSKELESADFDVCMTLLTHLPPDIDHDDLFQNDPSNSKDPERNNEIRKAIISLSMEKGKILTDQSDHNQSCESYKVILNLLNNNGSKEEKIAYESIIQSYVKIDKYDDIKQYILYFIQMAVKCYKLPSIELTSVLWFCGKVLEEQSDKSSPTKLCDLVDALRYYLCTFKISREIGGVTIGEESTAVAQKKIREKIEMILFNNRPLKPEDVALMVERMIQITTTDFLLNSSKSQNWLLKYVYPDFMAEDALREKSETLPSKSGFLSKMNGLMKSWKTRWFSLERDVLSYYKYHNDPKPQGDLNILEIKSIEILNSKEKKFKPYVHCFQLVHPKHTLILAAESEEVMSEWVKILNRSKIYWEDFYSINVQYKLNDSGGGF